MFGPDNRLAPLRQDLRIHRAAPLASGAPGWVILDPVRHRYFQISRSVLDILDAWPAGTIEAVRAQVAARTGRAPSDEEILDVRAFLESQELTQAPLGAGAAFAKKELGRKHHWIAWLIHNYLFIKIPLVRPQRFLDATRVVGDVVFSRASFAIFGLLGFFALGLVAKRWDTFIATAASFLTLDSLFTYGLSLVFVKSIHELGHAYMATKYGVRVPSMGVAFMVMAPFLYSDVSDAWRLKSREQRLLIDSAGIISELMLAVLALLLWVFLPDGGLRSVAFVTATTSLIATLFLNLNPFMRFDGYHILADLTGIPNLQTRAMAIGRWRLREFLWGLQAPPPERFPPRTEWILAIYAYSIWVYRFFLFLGIAFLVYHATFKVLGIILFLIEIVWFILRPIYQEVSIQWQGRARLMQDRRSRVTLGVGALAVACLFIPLSTRVEVAAMAVATHDVALYPKAAGQIQRIERRAGERVRQGDVILVLRSPDLAIEAQRSELRLALLDRRLARVVADAGDRSELTVLTGQRDGEMLRLETLRSQLADLIVRAPKDGVLRDWDPALRVGLWINVRTLIGRVIEGEGGEVRGYVAEADLRRLKDGAKGVFIPEEPLASSFPVRLTSVGHTAVEDLDLLALAAAHEGPIPATEDSRRLKPGVAIYPAVMTGEVDAPLTTSMRGRVFVDGVAESFATQVLRRLVGVLIRESGA